MIIDVYFQTGFTVQVLVFIYN